MHRFAAPVGLVCFALSSTASMRIACANDAPRGPSSQAPKPMPSELPSDEDRAQAERYFKAGLSLHKLDDFDAAAVAYEASLKLMPTKSALFNLANCQRALHQYVEALDTLERLQALFGEQLAEPMASKARAQMQELRNLTATLLVETQPPGAMVHVDGASIGETPLAAPLRLKLGRHLIEVFLEGYEPQTASVRLLPRASLTERFVLVPVAEQVAVPTDSKVRDTTPPKVESRDVRVLAAEAPDDPLRPWGWAGVAAGAASVALGGVFGLRALSLDEELSAACSHGVCPQDHAADIERLERLSATADTLIGVGAVFALAGAALVLWPTESNPTTPQVGLMTTPTFVGVATGGVW